MAGRRPFACWEVRVARPILKTISRINVWVYRLSRGRLGSRWIRGAPICLLTTIGRKTGEHRTTPVLYLADGERLIVVASQAGMPRHPSWYLNLQANPVATVQIGSTVAKMTACTASDEEKARYWPRLTAMYRDFDDYQARTARNIPVVVLFRADAP